MGGSKVVVSAVSIILVVGAVIGTVAVVNSKDKSEDGSGSGELSSSMRTVDALCAPALYKDNCKKTFGPVAHNGTASPKDYLTAGAKIALQEIIKMFNLTDTLVPKVNDTQDPKMTKMVVDDCKSLLEDAIEKLEAAIGEVGNPSVYKDSSKTWNLRLWLSDIVTYQDTCMDGFKEAKAPELGDVMKDGMVNSTELTMSVLDIVSYFSNSLSKIGYDLNATKVIESLKEEYSLRSSSTASSSKSRKLLLAYPLDAADGLPVWMSAGDRRLMAGGSGPPPPPNAVVAADGSGQFKTIQQALDAYDPKAFKGPGRYVIHVKAGVYKEIVVQEKKKPNILMYGDGPDKTVVTGDRSFHSGFKTSFTATVAIQSDDFFCRDMGFENTAGAEGHQAVALRVNAERAVFLNCKFDGYQDTLYPQGGSSFFRDCSISGTIDFIFGNAATVIQKCKIITRMPMDNQFNAITASGRLGPNMPTAIVIQDCDIVPDPKLDKAKIHTYLGRPWKPFARTVFMQSTIGDQVDPEGYRGWEDQTNHFIHTDTAYYAEFANTGPGADTAKRIKWPHVKVIGEAEANTYTVGTFLVGSNQWLADTPHYLGLKP